MAQIDRRGVLKGALGTAGLSALGGAAFAATAKPYRVGVVGAGWFGKLNLFSLMQVAPVEVVALADVDQHMLEEARGKTAARPDSLVVPKAPPAIYHDYRDMLKAHAFDIVIIATPDHWHALPAIAAMQAGANLYLEKPICVDIAEGQAMVAAARAHKRTVQVGTQRRTSAFMIEARDRVVREGLLGTIGHVEVFCYFHQRLAATPPPSTPPATLDWDFYCGPAQLIPYNDQIHPLNWRSYTNFCNGYTGDVGVHFFDTCRWMLGLGWPKRISSASGIYVEKDSSATVPDAQAATFEFDNLIMTWTNRQWGDTPNPAYPWGAAIHGEKGTLWVGDNSYDFIPIDKTAKPLSGKRASEVDQFPHDMQSWRADWERNLVAATRSNLRDFVSAMEAGTRPAADIEEGHISTAFCILANASAKLGRTITWDGARQRAVGDEEMQKLLVRPYRKPWIHPSA